MASHYRFAWRMAGRAAEAAWDATLALAQGRMDMAWDLLKEAGRRLRKAGRTAIKRRR